MYEQKIPAGSNSFLPAGTFHVRNWQLQFACKIGKMFAFYILCELAA
jgi:hypothetical protein